MSWDSIWKEKKCTTDFSLRWLRFLSRKAASLPEDAKILEAGCGSGEGIAVFADGKRTAIGSDISDEALKKTASRENVTAVYGDNFKLPFESGTFDLVFNSGVIEHYKYPQNVMQLKEMKRVTKDGGEVIINVPNSLCLWYIAIKIILLTLKKWRFGYEESYAPWRLRKTAEEAGLKVRGCTGFLATPPLATNNTELLPINVRKKLALLENCLPFKEFYCYSVCILCRK